MVAHRAWLVKEEVERVPSGRDGRILEVAHLEDSSPFLRLAMIVASAAFGHAWALSSAHCLGHEIVSCAEVVLLRHVLLGPATMPAVLADTLSVFRVAGSVVPGG